MEGKEAVYKTEPHPLNNKGEGEGVLIGGNLSLLSNVIGTASDFETKNRILFIEDIGEYLYNLDRMLYHLKRSGKLKKPAGIIIGRFTDMKDTERSFGKNAEQIIKEITKDLDCPVCFNFPVSHAKENVALKIGVRYHLKVTATKTTLTEKQP